MTVREQTESIEKQILSPYARLAAGAGDRQRPELPDPLRTCFQRDRDRIIHCKAFRRLKHKTQVFLAPEGDHYRTRLTHTLEVAQIARTIARSLRLNEDLTEAIALGHDLGHTPFGHAGERALDAVCPGGFRHYEQSVRVASRLEGGGAGLNLCAEVLNGFERHTSGEQPSTMEGRVVRLADRIAYINHDIDDACRAGVLREDDIPQSLRRRLGDTHSRRINTLITDCVEQTAGHGDGIFLSPPVQQAFDEIHSFLFERVYFSPAVKGEEPKVHHVLGELYTYFTSHPDQLGDEFQAIAREDGVPAAVCDFIAGMTDSYALEMFNRLFVPGSWKGNHR